MSSELIRRSEKASSSKHCGSLAQSNLLLGDDVDNECKTEGDDEDILLEGCQMEVKSQPLLFSSEIDEILR
jgi:hypothetical protein